MHAKAKRREASARKEDDRTYEALRAELWEADDSRATGKAYWRSNRVFREQSNRVFREQAGNVREVVVNQDGTWQGEEDRIACQGLSPDLSFNPKRRLLPKACASANSEGREAAVIPESRGLSVSWIHIHVPRFTQPRHHAVFLAVSGCPRELDLETSKSEHDHIVPLYDGPVPCYGATLDAPDFATVILAKFARTDRDCISPAHRAQKAVFMEMDELPPVLYDRQLFCYTRFCFSQDELDRLSTFRPWYLAAELEGRLWRFGHALSMNGTRTSLPLARMRQRDGEWERLAGYNDFRRVWAMRREVSDAHALLPEVGQWIAAVDRRHDRVEKYKQDAYWLGKFICWLKGPDSENDASQH
ncbi:hypothetical protein BDZ89DRAFT_1194979 [Hymenopellis radicata]|nr:hypothetical protein BDZ89DRAFT_1194979 [Hymenopellis radicata]